MSHPSDPGPRASLLSNELDPAVSDGQLYAIIPVGRHDRRVAEAPGPAYDLANGLYRRGRHWELRFGHRSHLLRHKKGLAYLAILLDRPGHSITAVDLKATVDGEDPRWLCGDSGETMDPAGLASVRTRVLELQEDLAEAKEAEDAHGQERITREIEDLVERCRKATGLGGRLRRNDGAEKVRIAVTNAIHRAVWSIEQVDKAAATYLRSTVGTGSLLSFQPQDGEEWDVVI